MRIYDDKSPEESYAVGRKEAELHMLGSYIGMELLEKLKALDKNGYTRKEIHEAMNIFSDDKLSEDFLCQIIGSHDQDSFIKGYVDALCSFPYVIAV